MLTLTLIIKQTDTGLMSSFPGQPGNDGTEEVKPIWILMMQKIRNAVASAGPYAHHLHLTPDR